MRLFSCFLLLLPIIAVHSSLFLPSTLFFSELKSKITANRHEKDIDASPLTVNNAQTNKNSPLTKISTGSESTSKGLSTYERIASNIENYKLPSRYGKIFYIKDTFPTLETSNIDAKSEIVDDIANVEEKNTNPKDEKMKVNPVEQPTVKKTTIYMSDNYGLKNPVLHGIDILEVNPAENEIYDVETSDLEIPKKFAIKLPDETHELDITLSGTHGEKDLVNVEEKDGTIDLRLNLPKNKDNTNNNNYKENKSDMYSKDSGIESDMKKTEEENAGDINKDLKNENHGKVYVQVNIFNNGAFGTPLGEGSTLETGNGHPTVGADESSYTSIDKKLDWWQTSVFYQVYPRSFKDTDGDGIGDLKGITSKVDYLHDVGVGAIWLSPVYKSPMADFGYDVSDFRDIEPIFGTLDEFDQLVDALHKRGIRIVMDFIPNHTSEQHPWFRNSIQRVEPFTDYYVWRNATGTDNVTGQPIPPNNWRSAFGSSAWEWNAERGQFYLHQYLKEQPDLNVRNPIVMEELDNIIRFWLDRGVDGLRLIALNNLFEAENEADEALDPKSQDNPNDYEHYVHNLTKNQPESLEAVRRWRKIIDQYEDRALVVEIFSKSLSELTKYYGESSTDESLAHFSFNFGLIKGLRQHSDVTGTNLKQIIDEWITNIPEGKWPNWVLGNHDHSRVSTGLGASLIDALNMLNLLLPGTPTTYYGEEIGMEDTPVTFDEAQDNFGLNYGPHKFEQLGRDPQRSPMQWDNTPNAGFSASNETWLPVNENYHQINVADELTDPSSHLEIYKRLVKLRKQRSFTHGKLEFPIVTKDILAFIRQHTGSSCFLIIINTSEKTVKLNPENSKDSKDSNKSLCQENSFCHQLEHFPKTAQILLKSSTDHRNETSIGTSVVVQELELLGGEGMVLKFGTTADLVSKSWTQLLAKYKFNA